MQLVYDRHTMLLQHQAYFKHSCAALCDDALSFQIALKLTQMQGPSREFQQPVLDIIIRNMYADVVDRKWDTQGSVSMGEVTVLDYITVGMCGCISPPCANFFPP